MTDAEPAPPPVAANLDREIQRLGLTHDDVAARLRAVGADKVGERLVRRWRKAEVVPSWTNLCALAAVFEREPGWFYVDHSDEPEAVAA